MQAIGVKMSHGVQLKRVFRLIGRFGVNLRTVDIEDIGSALNIWWAYKVAGFF